MEIRSKGYDRTLSLRELLSGSVPDKLQAALSALLGAAVRIVSADGAWVMGDTPPLRGGSGNG